MSLFTKPTRRSSATACGKRPIFSLNLGFCTLSLRTRSLSGSAMILWNTWCRALKHSRRCAAGVVATRSTSSASCVSSRSCSTSTGTSMSGSSWCRSSQQTASSRSSAPPRSIALRARTGGTCILSISRKSCSSASDHVSGTSSCGSRSAAAASASRCPPAQHTGARDTAVASPLAPARPSSRLTQASMSSTPLAARSAHTSRTSCSPRWLNISASAGTCCS
mmetsp:Transcript_96433/g.251352  ORF Transcript_96433/g.251352 Transcript_96433/m.251352 type:complete len:222 (-) Transcript_96433:35-700(-)